MRFLTVLLSYLSLTSGNLMNYQEYKYNCVTFSVSAGTGCAWMCQYCQNTLDTTSYYFTDDVCTYEEGEGCVGNPIQGVQYTCCSVSY